MPSILFVKLIVIVLCITSFLVGHVFGVKARFYEKANQTGFFLDYEATKGCVDLSKDFRYQIRGSVWTDGCILLYSKQNCKGFSFKVVNGIENIWKYKWELREYGQNDNLVDTKSDTTTTMLGHSFQFCEPKGEGGDVVNIDVLRGTNVVHSFENLCHCQNLPSSVVTSSVTSYNNHGNAFASYTEANCQGNYVVYPAGVTPISNFASRSHRSMGPIKSTNVQLCLNITAKVYKFEFLPPTSNGTVENKQLTSKTVFWNDGPAIISVTYEADETVVESVDMSVAKEMTTVSSWEVGVGVSVKNKAGVPFLGGAGVSASLEGHGGSTSKNKNSEEQGRTITNSKDIRITQQIQIPACTNYTATTHLTIAKDKVIPYKAYSKITGYVGKDRMTVQQLRRQLSPLWTIVSDDGKHTLETVSDGVMKVKHEIKSGIIGSGQNILGCTD